MMKSVNIEIEHLNTITEKIIGCAYAVSNELGCGFVEKVYEKALGVELERAKLESKSQHPLNVRYRGVLVGEFQLDMLVEDSVIVELKAVKDLDDVHTAQCINYLKASNLPVCLLLNFGSQRVHVKRFLGQGARL